jgi:hypothetical protein
VKDLLTSTRALPPIDEIRRRVHYDPLTGKMTWLRAKANGIKPGTEVGGVNAQGYRSFSYRQHVIKVHRLAFAFTHGRWPEPYCDHINGDKLDNRACNLRECSPLQSAQNRCLFKNSKSGIKGVSWDREARKWRARAWMHGRAKLSGRFGRLEDAITFVKQAREQLHGEFVRH